MLNFYIFLKNIPFKSTLICADYIEIREDDGYIDFYLDDYIIAIFSLDLIQFVSCGEVFNANYKIIRNNIVWGCVDEFA